MTSNEIVGLVFAVLIPLTVSIIKILKPIINLNNAITKLTVVMDRLIDDTKKHDEALKEHDKRLYALEKDK